MKANLLSERRGAEPRLRNSILFPVLPPKSHFLSSQLLCSVTVERSLPLPGEILTGLFSERDINRDPCLP